MFAPICNASKTKQRDRSVLWRTDLSHRAEASGSRRMTTRTAIASGRQQWIRMEKMTDDESSRRQSHTPSAVIHQAPRQSCWNKKLPCVLHNYVYSRPPSARIKFTVLLLRNLFRYTHSGSYVAQWVSFAVAETQCNIRQAPTNISGQH